MVGLPQSNCKVCRGVTDILLTDYPTVGLPQSESSKEEEEEVIGDMLGIQSKRHME